MKIQCNACEAAEAKVLCCADDAALCLACDEKVHAANKLASKHQRVPLIGSSSSQVPKCDICQEATGYFFCLEDRALLCRKCDIVIHSANSFVSAHQRFLLTGVKVGPEFSEQGASYAREPTCPEGRSTESPSTSLLQRSLSVSHSGETNQVISSHASKNGNLPASRVSFSCGSITTISDWPLDDFFGLQDFSQNYGFMDHGSSKADSGKLGSSEGSPNYLCFTDEEMDAECSGQVPERTWTVPDMPSPPTASGLHWTMHSSINENSLFVPDICSSYQPISTSAKRRRAL